MISYVEWVVEDVTAEAFKAPLEPNEEVSFHVVSDLYSN